MTAGAATVALCVLGSSSSGNCSVIRLGSGAGARAILIDAGLSPRGTRRLLGQAGLTLDHVDAVILTHLDTDHWRLAWGALLPRHVALWAPEPHRSWGVLRGLLPSRAHGFAEPFDPVAGVRVTPTIVDHDDLGAAALRLDFAAGDALGYATDLGRVTTGLLDLLRGVGVLAIESNYCRRMQLESDRPLFLKRRIMGGRGHLSNHECAEAVAALGPRHVVFLHLSRQCNRASLVSELHAGGDYEFTIAEPHRPTRWIRVAPAEAVPTAPRSALTAGAARRGVIP